MTYAGAFLDRDDITRSDLRRLLVLLRHVLPVRLVDVRQRRALIDPTQFIVGGDKYRKMSHELRFSSPPKTAGA
jgi:hypothetical protein